MPNISLVVHAVFLLVAILVVCCLQSIGVFIVLHIGSVSLITSIEWGQYMVIDTSMNCTQEVSVKLHHCKRSSMIANLKKIKCCTSLVTANYNINPISYGISSLVMCIATLSIISQYFPTNIGIIKLFWRRSYGSGS